MLRVALLDALSSANDDNAGDYTARQPLCSMSDLAEGPESLKLHIVELVGINIPEESSVATEGHLVRPCWQYTEEQPSDLSP